MASLAELRQKLKDQETKRGTKSSGSADKSNFPFWDMNENDSATVRFLPDVHLDGKYPEMSGDNPKSGIFPR
mgnify:CR=1 FL=1